jgi:hypothetical protein
LIAKLTETNDKTDPIILTSREILNVNTKGRLKESLGLYVVQFVYDTQTNIRILYTNTVRTDMLHTVNKQTHPEQSKSSSALQN